MLASVNLDLKLPKKTYKTIKDELVARLILLQQAAITNEIPAIVVFDGWDGAGKGSRISDLVCNLDARAFNVFVTGESKSDEEKRLPFMQPFWAKTLEHGKLSIFDQSWYYRAIREIIKVIRKQHPSSEQGDYVASVANAILERGPNVYSGDLDINLGSRINSIIAYEKQFADDGYIVLKFFMHISKEMQMKRLEALAEDKATSWRVSKKDFRRARHYDDFYKLYDVMLERTNFDYAPWCVVPSHEPRLANVIILQAMVAAYERALRQRGLKVPLPSSDFVLPYAQAEHGMQGGVPNPEEISDAAGVVSTAIRSYGEKEAEELLDAGHEKPAVEVPDTADDLIPCFPVIKMPMLEEVSHDLVLPTEKYRKQLEAQQDRLRSNQQQLYLKRIPMLLAFEGWDASGKGGTIKRISRALDARDYAVVPSASPTPVEKKHPFLWRYWARLPKTGHVAIYDRTWYGRVLVERIEGFANNAEWRRAYDEINEFEWEVTQWGAIILKFWLDISDSEQLSRFNARTENPDKQWKITDEDWRNRDKNPQYRVAVNDMLRLTSTSYAPWTIVENDDKYYGRIKVLKLINKTIEDKLLEV